MNDGVVRLEKYLKLEKHIAPEPNSGCWLWDGPKTQNGYGVVFGDGKPRLAHRVLYETLRGPIPAEHDLDHVVCNTRACVNPWHQEPVSHRENLLRSTSPSGLNARKTHCPAGHRYDDKNTLRTVTGTRRCRACDRARAAASRRARGIAPLGQKRICAQGHELDSANAYISKGVRRCLTCKRARGRATAARRRKGDR